jgi:hypothetical protein
MRWPLLMVALLVTPVHAAPIIDQQQTTFVYTTGFQLGWTDLAQTFTVGIPGRLATISIVAANDNLPIGLDLLDTSAGIPTSVIASAVVPIVSGNPSWITFDFSPDNIKVHPNEVLAFQPIVTGVHGQVVGHDLASGAEPDPYTRGEMFYKTGPCPPPFSCPPPTGGNWDSLLGMTAAGQFTFADMTFITTVSPPGRGVPEPWTISLFATGLGMMVWLAWRKKRKAAAV